jgi:hypothetical protein
VSLLKTVVGDALFGLRTFARKPGFTAVAVLALALGIAVNTAMSTSASPARGSMARSSGPSARWPSS